MSAMVEELRDKLREKDALIAKLQVEHERELMNAKTIRNQQSRIAELEGDRDRWRTGYGIASAMRADISALCRELLDAIPDSHEKKLEWRRQMIKLGVDEL